MFMGKIYDVIIIGGGPAGATAGLNLARRGLNVLLLEKKSMPRFKLCGGMITRKTIELAEEIHPGFYSQLEQEGIIENQCLTYLIKTENRNLHTARARHPFVLINREKYDFLWIKSAIQEGVQLKVEKAAKVDFSGCTVVTSSGNTYRGKFILAADGAGSRVRLELARKKVVSPPRSGYAALAVETFVPKVYGSFSDSPELILGLIKDGYAWSFPCSKVQAVGICSAKQKDGRLLKQRLLYLLKSYGVADKNQMKIQASLLPYGDYEPRPGYRNVLLLGDAAGLAEPLLGEGIYFAHASGNMAARAVLESKGIAHACVDLYAGYLGKIISSMRKRLLLRKLTLGLPPFLADKAFSFLLPLIALRLEEKIQGRHGDY